MARSLWRVSLLLASASLVCAALARPAGPGGMAQAGAGGKQSPSYAPVCERPGNAIVLFDGRDLRNWSQPDGRPAAWRVQNGVMTVGGGNIVTKETFRDVFIHVEFRLPNEPDRHGQGKANSGVYLQGRYEIQLLDSYGIKAPGKGDCGAIYGQHAALVNACKPPLEWQCYDAIFRAPRVDAAGKVTEAGRITVLQNGIVIQNNVEILGPTAGAMDDKVAEAGPLLLQDHGSPLRFRNIWLEHLPPKGSDAY